MAISPYQAKHLRKNNTLHEAVKVQEQRVDKWLLEAPPAPDGKIRVDMSAVQPVVVEALSDIYRNAGWNVAATSDRDGFHLVLWE